MIGLLIYDRLLFIRCFRNFYLDWIRGEPKTRKNATTFYTHIFSRDILQKLHVFAERNASLSFRCLDKESSCDLLIWFLTSGAANPKAESNANNTHSRASRTSLAIPRRPWDRAINGTSPPPRSVHTSTFPLNADVAVGPGGWFFARSINRRPSALVGKREREWTFIFRSRCLY